MSFDDYVNVDKYMYVCIYLFTYCKQNQRPSFELFM